MILYQFEFCRGSTLCGYTQFEFCREGSGTFGLGSAICEYKIGGLARARKSQGDYMYIYIYIHTKSLDLEL